MHKSKVIRTITESCDDPVRQGKRARPVVGIRSPAAGGGLAGSVPATSARSRSTTHADPRLGQKIESRTTKHRVPRRG